MKPLIKYPVLLLILMLLGYSEVFAHIYRDSGNLISVEIVKETKHYTTLPVNTQKVEVICIEEKEEDKDERLSLKKFTDVSFLISLVHLEGHIQQIRNSSSFDKYLSYHLSAQSSYLVFGVFRL